MKFKFLLFGIIFGSLSSVVLAHSFVPDFTKMQNLRCDFDEVIVNSNNAVVTENKRFKIFKLDDSNKKIYIHKEPIDKVSYYESDKIEFELQSLTDDFIEMSKTVIDRQLLTYTSTAVITYDNQLYGVRHAKSSGTCRFLN